MANALACEKCGNSIASDRLKLEFDGNCPWCLAAFALDNTHSADPAVASLIPNVKSSDRLGKYLLTEKLGTGGMGEVWKALDTELNRWVALKFLKDQDPKELARFSREAHMAAKLSHPNIAAVHEIGEVGGRHYIAMQCIEGRTLETFRSNDRRLLVRLCLDAAKALDHAHRHGVIHRDVKPGNLMVEETEEGMKVVVLDFGLARSIEGGEKLSMSGSVVGTPQYLSPEQARAEKLDERTDVYSLGATMYEVFTGKALFEGENVYEILKKIENEAPIAPRKIKPQINQDLQTIILKCLEKDRERRYAGAKELASDLRRFLNHEAVLARPPSAIYRLRMRLSKRKAVMSVAASALVMVAGLLLFLVPKVHEADRGAEKERSRAGARSLAQPHIDLARILLQRMEQVLSVDEDRTAELEREGRKVREGLEKALAVSPGHEEALFEMGRAHGILGYRERAVEWYSKAIEASPRMTKAYLERALLNLDLYERLRHQLDGKSNPGTENSAKLLATIRSDVRKVSEWSKDIPQLKHAEALLLFTEGKWAEAAERWKECVDVSPGDAIAWMWRGHALIHAGRPGDAVAALDRTVHLKPRTFDARKLRGLAQFELKDFEAAIADFTKDIEISPWDALALSNRGAAKVAKGLFDDAITDCTKAIKLDETCTSAYSNRAAAKSALGRHDEAMADHAKAIESDPGSAAAHYKRGFAKAERDLHEDAIVDFDKAVILDPKFEEAFRNRGVSKYFMGLYDEAILDCTTAIGLNGKSAAAYCNRGSAKSAKGDGDEAIKDFSTAIELDPTIALAYYNRAGVWLDKGLLVDAIEDYTTAIAKDPKYSMAFNNRGLAKYRQGLYDDADADYEKALKFDPKNASAFGNRGFVRARRGLIDEAIVEWRKALEVAPANWPDRAKIQRNIHTRGVRVRLDEACRLLELKKYREGIAIFEDVVKAHPGTMYARDAAYNIACGFALLGEKKNALDWLEKAVVMGWNDVAHLEKDSDLESLRNEDRYKELTAELRAN